jgi:membrane-bound serine protease (ClpP class)
VAVLAAVLLAVFVLPAPWGLVAVAGGLIVEVGEAVFWVRWSRRRRSTVGAEALIGAAARVVEPCRPLGRVRVQGELWRARCERGADVGDTVHVAAVDGLTLLVD